MKKLIVIAGLLLFISSCYNDKYNKLYPPATTAVTCDTTAVSFQKDIQPIIASYCSIPGGCHDATGSNISGYNFTIYVGIARVANHSMLIDDLNQMPSTSTYHAMPLNLPQIPACDINKFTAWVNQGALNN